MSSKVSPLQLQRCPTHKALTQCCKGDGFGAQFSALFSVFAYALNASLTFCTTPWTRMEHGVSSINGGHGTSTMWEFVGGPQYGPPATVLTAQMEVGPAMDGPSRDRALPFVQQFYHRSPKPKLRWFRSGNNVAVHIRRGDVHRSMTQRWVDVNITIACVARVLKLVQFRNASVHVFSDAGSEGELTGVDRLSVMPTIHLRGDIRATFHHMVMANAFIGTASAFSGAVGFLRGDEPSFDGALGSGCVTEYREYLHGL